MTTIESVSVKISNYKCFAEEPYGYEKILPFNLIIGRNNTGKSTLLDVIDYLTHPSDLNTLGHKGNSPRVLLGGILSEEDIGQVFSRNISGGSIPGNHWEYGRRWVHKPATWAVSPNGFELVSVEPPFEKAVHEAVAPNLAQVKGNPFRNFRFKRLLADRDIIRETEADVLEIQSNGQGVTNAIRAYLNKASLPSSLVEQTLTNELNSIFEPDGKVNRILVQQTQGPGSEWELYFEESEKGRVPLSHTGSGLKTILLVLAFLHLVPHMEGKPLTSYLFGFEELENNLHPALLRRLLLYLRDIAVNEGCHFFLTTHSNVAIDLFSSDDQAQILHTTHDRTCASVRHVTTYVENKGVLDDLDVRASDLLQSNGVVWLEGPSDRLYFNRWVALWTNGELREGAHYQCVFYGGRLLAHLSAADPDVDSAEVVKILRVNRNAIMLIDSDKRRSNESLNTTKQRIISEVETFGGMAWVTAGKEVENYIPAQAISSLYGRDAATSLERYGDFSEFLDGLSDEEGRRFLRNKVLYAEKICPHITVEDMTVSFDLKAKINEACNRIRSWNGKGQ